MKIKEIIRLIVAMLLVVSLAFVFASCNFKNNSGDDNKESGNESGGDKEEEKEEEKPGDAEGDKEEDKKDDEELEEDKKEENPSSAKYPKVAVVQDNGEAISGVIVIIYNLNGERVGMNPVTNGVAEFKDVALGDYTVELKFTKNSDKYAYDQSLCVLSAENYELEINVYSKLGSPNYEIYGPAFDGASSSSAKAYTVGTGSYSLKTKAGRTYFVFVPDRSGVFGISCSGGENIKVGCYGIPNYVQPNDIFESDGGSFSLEVSPLQGDLSEYTPFVIGLDAEGVTDCIFKIEYLGKLSDKPAFMPWNEINAKMDLEKYSVPSDKTFTSLDITSADLKVVLDSDGYYHLGTVDGPLVVCKITEPTEYIVSFYDICQTSNFGWYHFEGETFVKKERFNLLIESYAEICDENLGVCPLTEELAYAIQMNGEYHNWWNFSTENHIFGENAASINAEVAWLFACGIIK